MKSESTPGKDYIVIKKHDCDSKQCNILCRECVCCMSAFKCTCISFSIQNNLCKHIHAVKINSKPIDAESYSGKLFAVPIENSCIPSFTEISNSPKPFNKDTVVKEIYNLYLKATATPIIDECIGKKILDSVTVINSLLDIPLNKDSFTFQKSKEPHNKKLIPQRRFYSTKKTNSVKKRKIAKPSAEESEDIKNSLLKNPLISRNVENDHLYYTKK